MEQIKLKKRSQSERLGVAYALIMQLDDEVKDGNVETGIRLDVLDLKWMVRRLERHINVMKEKGVYHETD